MIADQVIAAYRQTDTQLASVLPKAAVPAESSALALEEQGIAALLGSPAAIIARDDAVRRAYLDY
jgi:hypothetical protein